MRSNRATLVLALLLALSSAALAKNKWYVDGVNGNDSNNCKSAKTACKSIGHAISLASSGDSVMVAAATYTENLTIGPSLTITGFRAQTTIIDGGGANTVVTISSSAQATLSDLTIRNGKAEWGGGIYNNGTLTISNSMVVGNASVGKGFRGAQGGGIINWGNLTLTNSTVSGNTAMGSSGGVGGGVYNGGTATITNSTLYGNTTSGAGGGIYNPSNLMISSSTLSQNSAGFGGGIYSVGSAISQNSIVADNSGGNWGNCEGIITSNGYNLSSDGTCTFNGPGDLNNIDPMLGPLENNGGRTQTQALLSGSPAIDAGNPNGCTDGNGQLLETDQRGKPRPDEEDTSGCDMGAYERQKD